MKEGLMLFALIVGINFPAGIWMGMYLRNLREQDGR